MATFTFKKPSSGGSGDSLSYTLLLNRIETLKAQYTDFNGNIIDEQYYKEVMNEYQKALNGGGLTVNQQQDVANSMLSMQTEQRGFQVKNQKVYNITKDSLESNLNDDWNMVWKNGLKNMDLNAMSEDMLTSVDYAKSELQQLLNVLETETNDTAKIENVTDLITELDNKETFWRGVQAVPNEYALVADSSTNGISNLTVKRMTDIPDKYYKIDGVDYGGVKVFVNPSGEKDDMGNEIINFGNGVWKGTKSTGFVFDADLSGATEFNPKSISNVPFMNYQKGTTFKKSDGGYYVFDGNGQYLEYANEELLKADGFSSDNAVAVNDDESDKIKRQFSVQSITSMGSTKSKQAEIQTKLGDVASSVSKEVSPSFTAEGFGESIGQTFKSFVPATAGVAKESYGLAKTGLSKGLENIKPSNIANDLMKADVVAGKVGGFIKDQYKKRVNTAQNIFKGIWSGIKGKE